jgi:predicted alpha/beta-fold hydrolase
MTDFSVAWPFGNPHLQTLGAALPVFVRPPETARDEALRVPIDGGKLHAFAWWQPARAPAVLLVHGVGGSVSSQYVVRAAKAFFAAGFHTIRMNMRGAGESIADAPSLYHAGIAGDLRVMVDAIAASPQVDGVSVVGFSLGGNCALCFAGQAPNARAVVAISAPLDLATVSRLLNRPLNLPYRAYILRALLREARTFARLHPNRARYTNAQLRRVFSIWDYDDVVVAPMHGFGTAERYYAQASSGQFLPKIQVPTLLIHANDDPLVPGHTVEPFLAERSSAVELAWSARGGHVGWFSGLAEPAWLRTWAIDRAISFLARVGPQ